LLRGPHGTSDLQTAPLYRPGAAYAIAIAIAIAIDGVRQVAAVPADATGRLALQVTLNGLGTPRTLVIGR